MAAATLSHRYIADRFLPDKAVDLVDEAAKKAAEGHPATFRAYISTMAARGKLYIRFLQDLAKLFVRAAKAVDAACLQAISRPQAPAQYLFGKR